MIRLLIRPVLLLTLLLALPVWLIQPQPADDSALTDLLTPSEDCAAPCFMGIRPGSTKIEEAIAVLGAHPWVEELNLDNVVLDVQGHYLDGWASWTWSDARPAMIDASYPGRVSFQGLYGVTVVSTLDLRTHFNPYELQAWYGRPSGSNVTVDPQNHLTYGVVFHPRSQSSLTVISTRLDCPVSLLDYWYSRATIVMTSWEGISGPYVNLSEAVSLC